MGNVEQTVQSRIGLLLNAVMYIGPWPTFLLPKFVLEYL